MHTSLVRFNTSSLSFIFFSFLAKNSLHLGKKLPSLTLLIVRLLRCWHPKTGGQWLLCDAAGAFPGCARVVLDCRNAGEISASQFRMKMR